MSSSTSREEKKAAFYEKLMLLRHVTNSTSKDKTSILVDASKYIEELKQKVETLNQEIGTSSSEASSTIDNSLPLVTVETLEKGFLINLYSGKNCSGLLVSVLEAFEELGLDVLDARVSCSDSFQLEAVGGDHTDQGIDSQVVKEAVLQAIKNVQENQSNEE